MKNTDCIAAFLLRLIVKYFNFSFKIRTTTKTHKLQMRGGGKFHVRGNNHVLYLGGNRLAHGRLILASLSPRWAQMVIQHYTKLAMFYSKYCLCVK